MPAFLTLDSVSLAAPDGRSLFDGLTLAIGRQKTGLVGRNGSGKSTLIRALLGEVAPAAGSLHRSGRVGVLRQAAEEAETLAEALGVAGDLARLARLETGAGSLDDAAEADWTLSARVEAALAQTGLPALDLDRRIASLSGGERTRLMLARLLVEAPDVLLLDEPTNNLDADGRAAVTALLDGWRGGAVVASHDRDLLEVMDRIVELTPVGVTVFGGPWSAFEAARDAARERAEETLDRAARDLRQTELQRQAARERQDRQDKAGRAKRARNDAPKILLDARQERAEQSAARNSRLDERLVGERGEALVQARTRLEVITPFSIDLPTVGLPPGRDLLELENVTLQLGGRLLGPLSLRVRSPDRVAVQGPNGAGKSTLLRLMAGDIGPVSGEIRRLTRRVARLDQHVGLLDPDQSILDNLRRLNPGVSENAARALLARFAFRNTAALQPAGTLSGGERMRAGLACAFAAPEAPELLLLDEPTNHLDLDAVKVLEQSLASYDGAVVVVSHDTRFLERIGVSRTIGL